MKKYYYPAILITIGLIISVATPLAAKATATTNSNLTFTPQVPIPNTDISGTISVDSSLIANYTGALYTYALDIVGVLAVIMLMVAGLIWLTSRGDSGQIGKAKKMLSGSLIGLFLLLGANILLRTINPDLINLKPITGITNIAPVNVSPDFLTTADKIQFVCLQDNRDCSNTNPPSLNVDINACDAKFSQERINNTCVGTNYPNRFCCGMNNDTQKKANAFCINKAAGTACQINETAALGTGYCFNNECLACKYAGSSCVNDYECQSATWLKCGFGDTNDTPNPSTCRNGFCAGATAKENEVCGANNSGKCLKTLLFICPANTYAVSGGTSCDTYLKCCK